MPRVLGSYAKMTISWIKIIPIPAYPLHEIRYSDFENLTYRPDRALNLLTKAISKSSISWRELRSTTRPSEQSVSGWGIQEPAEKPRRIQTSLLEAISLALFIHYEAIRLMDKEIVEPLQATGTNFTNGNFEALSFGSPRVVTKGLYRHVRSTESKPKGKLLRQSKKGSFQQQVLLHLKILRY